MNVKERFEKLKQKVKQDKKLARGLWAGLAIVLMTVIYVWYNSHYETTDDAFIDGHIVPISARVPGHVWKSHVTDNQQLKKGQLVVELDPSVYQAQVDQARAGVEQADANAVDAIRNLERYEALIEKSDISQQQFDDAKAQALSAQAQVDQAKAALAQAELNLSYTKVYVPNAGKVTERNVEPGMYVNPGQPLFSLVRPDIWVTANFKETQLTYMRPGQPVTIHVDTYPGKKFKATVNSIQAGSGARFSLFPPENATGNYVKVVQRVPVKITFDEAWDPAYPIGPGMSVEPRVKVK